MLQSKEDWHKMGEMSTLGKNTVIQKSAMSTRLDRAEAASLVSPITLHENGNENQVYQWRALETESQKTGKAYVCADPGQTEVMVRLWNRSSKPGAACKPHLTEREMRECGLIHAAALKMGQSGIVVQSVPGYLCNRAVGEEQHKVDSGLLQWCFGGCTEPAQLLCWCHLGQGPLVCLCRGLHAVFSFSLGTLGLAQKAAAQAQQDISAQDPY